jgi:cytochrome c
MKCCISSLAAVFIVVTLALSADDSARGKDVFGRHCGGCHGIDNDKEGPRLRGVFGRPSGSIGPFKYSHALKNAHITWNAEPLDKWLTDPEKVVGDNDMAFHVESAEERTSD